MYTFSPVISCPCITQRLERPEDLESCKRCSSSAAKMLVWHQTRYKCSCFLLLAPPPSGRCRVSYYKIYCMVLESNLLLSLTKHVLLERSETVFLSIQDGCIPLLLAVEAGNVGIVRELLSGQSEPQLRAVKTVSTIWLSKPENYIHMIIIWMV